MNVISGKEKEKGKKKIVKRIVVSIMFFPHFHQENTI